MGSALNHSLYNGGLVNRINSWLHMVSPAVPPSDFSYISETLARPKLVDFLLQYPQTFTYVRSIHEHTSRIYF